MTLAASNRDLCVIGGGDAGFAIAQAGVALGLKVTLIDSGSAEPCWRNWDVAVAVLKTVMAQGAGDQGADAFARMQSALDRALHAAAPDRRYARLAAMNIEVVRGRARFTGGDRVAVDGHRIQARRFVLATGVRSPTDGTQFHSHKSLVERLRRGSIPSEFLALGGDERAVALSLGMARLGIAASIDSREELLPAYDAELLRPIQKALRECGVGVRAAAEHRPAVSNESALICAPAVEPALADLEPAVAGLDVRDGRLCLSPSLRTTNSRVFAIGGVAGARSSQALQAQVGVVVRSAMFRLPARYDPALVPRCTFTLPGVAAVGLDETDARAQGAVSVWRWPLAETAIGAAQAAEGWIKVVTDRRGTVLGAGLSGCNVEEQIGLWTMAVRTRSNLSEIATLPLPSPSLAEGSRRVASQLLAQRVRSPWAKRALNMLRWLQ